MLVKEHLLASAAMVTYIYRAEFRYAATIKEPSGGWTSGGLSLQYVHITAEKCRSSTEGYAAGASIPISTKNACKVEEVGPHAVVKRIFLSFIIAV